MEVLHARCAGLDISKRDAKVCVRVAGAGRHKTVETVTTWGSMTSQILALREHLIAERITCAVMEATGDYWKPSCYRSGQLVPANAVQEHHVAQARATWRHLAQHRGVVRGLEMRSGNHHRNLGLP